ncbi:hypothetical protein Srot_0804 [Segniliparus rotundus DSM 44985]|uniref:Uncharacterized protein n=2 Tax=Segniliparus rotundus TaxID=286802 RepID=D6ZE03_SEGRD|nr:hypothetical protein Srot_0804 [Segniliparus rotundus DSM 44985]
MFTGPVKINPEDKLGTKTQRYLTAALIGWTLWAIPWTEMAAVLWAGYFYHLTKYVVDVPDPTWFWPCLDVITPVGVLLLYASLPMVMIYALRPSPSRKKSSL